MLPGTGHRQAPILTHTHLVLTPCSFLDTTRLPSPDSRSSSWAAR